MQSRHTLPGWYGLGSAVADFLAEKPDGLAMLQEMYRRWPFWRTLIDNVQMILAKADMTIARLYADLVDDQALASRIYDRIADEYRPHRRRDLPDHRPGDACSNSLPILQHSIDRRNPYVDPLSFIQLVMLKRLRAGEEPREELLDRRARKHQRHRLGPQEHGMRGRGPGPAATRKTSAPGDRLGDHSGPGSRPSYR